MLGRAGARAPGPHGREARDKAKNDDRELSPYPSPRPSAQSRR
jgi:hypothetical protein